MECETVEWRLTYHPEFELLDEANTPISISQPKLQQLFAALAQAGPEGIGRDQLAERLWPGTALDQRRVNFRQALARLKRLLGKGQIISLSATCALRGGLRVRFAGESSAIPSGRPAAVKPFDAFVAFLTWRAEKDPSEVFELLRSNLDFSLVLPSEMLIAVVGSATPKLHPCDPNRFWGIFWKGVATMHGHSVFHAMALCRYALEGANEHDDRVLLSEAAHYLAICRILAGQPQSAISLLDRAEDASRQAGSVGLSRIQDARCSALIHSGRDHDGRHLLDSQAESSQTALEHAKKEALKALYCATEGRLQAANDLNRLPQALSREIGSESLIALCSLISGYVLAVEQPASAISLLNRLLASCKANGFAHLQLYAQETLALAYLNLNERAAAEEHLKKSGSLRSKLGFGYTKWDKSRLNRFQAQIV